MLNAMDDQEYQDLKRYITIIHGEKKVSRPVGRPKGCKDKKKRKPRKEYPQSYDLYADERVEA